MDARYNFGASGVKKKRGRPRKMDTVLLPGEISALAVAPKSDEKIRKPMPANSDTSHSGDASHTLLGQPVHGVVDGSFDAGYLVTVRVGNSDTIFRGVVFGPGLSIPLSKTNDVAPKVKTTKKDVKMPASSPTSISPAAAIPSPDDVYRCTAIVTTLPTSAGTTETMQLSSEQEIMNFMQQQNFIHEADQSFAAQALSTPIRSFHLANSQFGLANSHFGAGARGDAHTF